MPSRKSTKTPAKAKSNSRDESKNSALPNEAGSAVGTAKGAKISTDASVQTRRPGRSTQVERKPSGVKHHRAATTQTAAATTQTGKVKPIEEAAARMPVHPVPEFAHEEIAAIAYSYWQERNCAHGHEKEDWARAEETLLARHTQALTAGR